MAPCCAMDETHMTTHCDEQGAGAALCLQHGGGQASTVATKGMADETDAAARSEPHYLAVVSVALLDRWSLFKVRVRLQLV